MKIDIAGIESDIIRRTLLVFIITPLYPVICVLGILQITWRELGRAWFNMCIVSQVILGKNHESPRSH